MYGTYGTYQTDYNLLMIGCSVFFLPSHGSTAVVDRGFLIFEVLVSHSYTPHAVGLLWTSDRPVAEACT